MKKALLSALAICMIFLASCNKDNNSGNGGTPGGTQTVLRKISQVHYDEFYQSWSSEDYGETWTLNSSSNYSDKDRWEWDGNKIKMVKNYNEDGILSYIDEFFYNSDNLVSEIRETYCNEDEDYYWSLKFSYTNKKFSKIEIFEDGYEEDKWDVTCDSEGKITKLRLAYVSDWKSEKRHRSRFLEGAKNIQDVGDEITLKWENGNVVEMTEYYTEDLETYTVRFIYDDAANPYHGNNSLVCKILFDEDLKRMSKNNCTMIIEDGEISEYEYNYYEDYPMEMISRQAYQSDNAQYMYKSEYTYTISYSYVE